MDVNRDTLWKSYIHRKQDLTGKWNGDHVVWHVHIIDIVFNCPIQRGREVVKRHPSNSVSLL